MSLALWISPGLLWPDPLHLPGKGRRWGVQLRGACAGTSSRALCQQARVCLPAPVLSVLIIRKCSLDDWSLPTGAEVEGSVLHACLEPLDPKYTRGVVLPGQLSLKGGQK